MSDENKGFYKEPFDKYYIIMNREHLKRIFKLSEYKNLDYPFNEEMKKFKEMYF